MPLRVMIFYTTTSSLEDARRISRLLVEEKLAACATIVGEGLSIYRWQGRLEEAKEYVLLIKTREELAEPLMRRLREVHPYEVPEMLAVSVSAISEPYLKWLEDETGP